MAVAIAASAKPRMLIMNKSTFTGILIVMIGMLASSACDKGRSAPQAAGLLTPVTSGYNSASYLAQEKTLPRPNRNDGAVPREQDKLADEPSQYYDEPLDQQGTLGQQPPGPMPPVGGPNDDFFLDGGLPITTFAVPAAVCGNGELEPTEQCDDGNFDNQDGCNVLCRFNLCGNGLLEKFEECDDNNNLDGDGCSRDCIYEVCGNKRVETGEQCDDGNRVAGDGCSPCCLFERCGNGVLDPGEQCDDGNKSSGDGCSDCCMIEPATP